MKRMLPFATIVVLAVITHGLILLNDGIFWDGWLNYTYVTEGRWGDLYTRYFLPAGRPMYAVLLWTLGYFPNALVAHRLLVVASYASAGCIVYALVADSRYVNKVEALVLALIVVTYPAFQVAFEFTLFPYVASCFFFALGAALAIKGDSRVDNQRTLCHTVGILFFALSFTVESFVFLYVVLFGLFTLVRLDSAGTYSAPAVLRFFRKNLAFFVLPFLFWFAHEHAFPSYGPYGELNSIQLNPTRFSNGLVQFMREGVMRPLNNIPVIIALTLTLAVIVASRRNPTVGREDARRRNVLLLTVVATFLAATVPYLLVSRWPNGDGWSTRHNLLIVLPVAVAIILLFRSGRTFFDRHPVVRIVIAGTIISSFVFQQWENYIYWQTRAIKDQAIVAELRHLERTEEVSVYFVEDKTGLARRDSYRFYDWTGLFRQAWGTEAHLGLSNGEAERGFLQNSWWFSNLFLTSDVEPDGCRAQLTITRNGSRHFLNLVVTYFHYKYFDPPRLAGFLNNLLDIQVHSLECPESRKEVLARKHFV